MRKIINNKVYDTDKAKLQASNSKKQLYLKKNGEYFLYNHSKEKIIPMQYEEAKKWAKENISIDKYNELFESSDNLQAAIKNIRQQTGLNKNDFAEKYGIPISTYEKWERGENCPPDYVVNLLKFKVEYNLRIEKERFLKDVIDTVADDLNIEPPELEYNLEKKSKGNISALVLDENREVNAIAISDEINMNDLVFSIVHELRHAYQIKYHSEMFDNYKQIGEISFEKYNLQEAEIDANAYASLFVEYNFKIKPLFNGYSQKVKKLIEKRKKEIIQNG